MSIFDDKKLLAIAKKSSADYIAAELFPHIVIDNFMDEARLQQALDAFPAPDALKFKRFNDPSQKKLGYSQVENLPDPIASILYAMNQPLFLQFLENLTGIKGLIPDPYYHGGGLHQITRGGKLDVHIDFNFHKKLNLERRLNALLYLNKDWQEDYGGHFEIWRGNTKDNGDHYLTECVNRILPLFNRFVAFSTSEISYHGHPDPLLCPEGQSRKSLALYYYTVDRPEIEKAEPHSTIFVQRPQHIVEQAVDPGYREPKKRSWWQRG